MCWQLVTCNHLDWLKFLVLLICVNNAQLSPPPQNIPSLPDLRDELPELIRRYSCDFNQQNLCDFKSSGGGGSHLGWSFHQSRRELADQLKRVAEAAFAASYSDDSLLNNSSHPTSIIIPIPNYFPCALSDTSSPLVPDTIHPLLASLDLSVLWPFLEPVNPIQRPTDVTHSSARLWTRSITAHFASIPLVCLHMQFRFPNHSDSQFSIYFASSVLSLKRTKVDDQLTTTPLFPANVWINLTLPLHANLSAPSTPTDGSSAIPVAKFDMYGTSWLVYELHTLLQLKVSQNVCLDTARFLSLLTVRNPTSDCVRSLSWTDSRTGSKHVIPIDAHGLPIRPAANSNLDEHNSPGLRSSHNRDTIFQSWMSTFRLTGSLVLAIAVTLFFLLFVCTVSISILMAYSHHSHHSQCCSTAETPVTTKSSSNQLIECETIKYPAHSEFSPMIGPDEPHSTQCGESLFQNGGGTDTLGSHSAVMANMAEASDSCSDMTATCAAQLMRNRYFYSRRANRARAKQPNSCGVPPTRSAQSRCPISNPELYRHQPRPVQRNPVPSVALVGNSAIRQSLILCTDADNQLVIKPATSLSISNVNHSDTEDPLLLTSIIDSDECDVSASNQIDSTCFEMAESVRQLDDPGLSNPRWSSIVVPPSDSNTPSTRACSQTSVANSHNHSESRDFN